MTSIIKTLSLATLIAAPFAQASEAVDSLAGTSWSSAAECVSLHFGSETDDSGALRVEIDRLITCSPLKTIGGVYSLKPITSDGFGGLIVKETAGGNVMDLGEASWLHLVVLKDQLNAIEITRSKIEDGKVNLVSPIKLRKVK